MTQEAPRPMTYRDAGVDIDAGNRLVSLIRGAARSTARPGVRSGLGGFGALFELPKKYRHPLLVSTTDGVGTKLKLAFATGRHDTVGVDLVAMSVNDLVVQGAEPLFFLDYFATGKLDPDTAAVVIGGIAEGCRQAGCALVGGETAEMPDFYPPGEYDLAGFAVGAVERNHLIDGSRVRRGDVILGLASSGPHSNGYSLIRKLVMAPGGPGLDAPFQDGTLADALLAPTRIYVRAILALHAKCVIHGIVHITGGGFWENIPRILPKGIVARIKRDAWTRPPVFDLIRQLGHVTEEEMLRTFNCGVGMVVIVPEEEEKKAISILTRAGETVFRLGRTGRRPDPGPAVVIA